MQPYLETLAAVIEDPASNLTAAVLLLAAILLLLLIIVVIVLVVLVPGREVSAQTAGDASRPDAQPDSRLRRKDGRLRAALIRSWSRLPHALHVWAVGAVVLGAIGGSYVYSGSTEYCAQSCHQMGEAAVSWRASTHADVSCIRCHEGRPATSVGLAALSRAGYAIGSLSDRKPGAVELPAGRCLQCHRFDIEQSIETTSGIRMDHEAPMAAGIGCAECHDEVGHVVERPSRPSRMQVCLRCHDGNTVSSACPTCHIGDVGDQPVFGRVYRKAALPQPTCGGCHDETTCDNCHGLRMPHSQTFIDGDHARDAGFDKKLLCWRCHPQTDCGQCHGDFTTAHGGPEGNFRQLHKTLSSDAACNGCHADHQGPFCERCH